MSISSISSFLPYWKRKNQENTVGASHNRTAVDSNIQLALSNQFKPNISIEVCATIKNNGNGTWTTTLIPKDENMEIGPYLESMRRQDKNDKLGRSTNKGGKRTKSGRRKKRGKSRRVRRSK